MRKPAIATLLAMMLIISSIPAINFGLADTGGDAPANVSVMKRVYAPGEEVRIYVSNGSGLDVVNGSSSIDVYIFSPGGGIYRLTASGENGSYVAVYVPEKGGEYMISLDPEGKVPHATFMVDAIVIDSSCEVVNGSESHTINVRGNLSGLAGPKATNYTINCTLDGGPAYEAALDGNEFSFSIDTQLQDMAAELKIVAFDSEGVMGTRIETVILPFREAGDEFVYVDAFGPLNVTNHPWPAESQWVPYLNQTWQPIRAPSNDISPASIDIISGGNTSRPVWINNSVFVYYNSTAQFLFYRMLLRGDPRSGGLYSSNVWGMMLDIDNDGIVEWGAFLDGSNPDQIKMGYNSNSPSQIIQYFIYTQSANPLLGFTRVTVDNVSLAGSTMYYLEWQVPLSGYTSSSPLSPGNVTTVMPVRMFFGTSTGGSNTFNRDLCGAASINFSLSAPISAVQVNAGAFGVINDTRDTNPPSNLGNWTYGQNVTASGYGWPMNNASISNLTVRVTDPNGTIVNTVTFNYTTTNGTFKNTSIWSVPSNGSNIPGYYGIWVRHPITGVYNRYDNFTILDTIPPVVRNVTVTPGIASPGSNITITANVTDNFRVERVTVTFSNVTLNMTYNATIGLYEVKTTAPVTGGTYNVTVTAYDPAGNVGTGMGSFTVTRQDPMVTKYIFWNVSTGRYNVTLNATNTGPSVNMTIYDYIPAGFTANIGGTDYHGPLNLKYSNVTATGGRWFVNYTVRGNVQAYYSTELYVVGLEPMPDTAIMEAKTE